MNEYYCYAYFYPENTESKLSGQCIYIGKGKGNRLQDHRRKSSNVRLDRLLKKYGDAVTSMKLHEHLSEEEAFEFEFLWIQMLGRTDLGTGDLFNNSEGGAGGAGYAGHKHSAETRKKQSASAKAQWDDPDLRADQSDRAKAQWHDPVYQEKRLAQLSAMNSDPVYQEKNLAQLAALNSDPVYQEKKLAQLAALNNDPIFQEKRLAHLAANRAAQSARAFAKRRAKMHSHFAALAKAFGNATTDTAVLSQPIIFAPDQRCLKPRKTAKHPTPIRTVIAPFPSKDAA
jgi:hypothetical protein